MIVYVSEKLHYSLDIRPNSCHFVNTVGVLLLLLNSNVIVRNPYHQITINNIMSNP